MSRIESNKARGIFFINHTTGEFTYDNNQGAEWYREGYEVEIWRDFRRVSTQKKEGF